MLHKYQVSCPFSRALVESRLSLPWWNWRIVDLLLHQRLKPVELPPGKRKLLVIVVKTQTSGFPRWNRTAM